MSDNESTLWLETVFAHYKNDFRDPFDALIAFVHWCYIRQGFACIGSPSAEMEITPARIATLLRDSNGGSELLPVGWNADAEGVWTLGYKLPTSTSIVLLKAVKMDNDVMICVMRPESDSVKTVTLTPSDHVNTDLTLPPKSIFKNLALLKREVEKEIVEPFLPPKSQSNPNIDSRDDRDDRGPPPSSGSFYSSPHQPDPDQPDPFGRSDLDPFGGGRGGMIFDPLRTGRGGGPTPLGPDGRPMPLGAVPPGARFDPFTPFGGGGVGGFGGRGRGRGRGVGPDPDHEPPPGWDDMFM